MGWNRFRPLDTRALSLLTLTAFAFTGCSSAPLVNNQSFHLNEQRNRLPTSVGELTRHEEPFEGRLPLGLGARVNVFMAESAHGVDTLYSDVLKPMRAGKLFRSQPFAIDYAVRDRGDSFDEGSKLTDLDFESKYDIRLGMSRRFHRFGDFLNPKFWMASGRFAPEPPKQRPPGRTGWNPLFTETAPPLFESEDAEETPKTISLLDVIE